MFFIQIKAFFLSFFAPPFWGRIFLLFPFLGFSHLILAQTPLSNERILTVSNPSEILVQDTLTIVPNSVQIIDSQSNTYLNSTYFSVKNNLILLKKTANATYSVRYRVLPFDLNKKHFRIDSSKIDPLATSIPVEFEYTDPATVGAPIFDKGLDYSGQYTQGFSLGNNQNLVVNQNFNLNLTGRLGDLDILASMTDNNLPIQAEGNTQQLREFDKIFIQLKKKNHSLIAGDYELAKPNNAYFLTYFKKLQGVTYSNSTTFGNPKTAAGLLNLKAPQLFTKASLAIARGKFARNTLPVVEGNQGPYRLVGTEGSNFFIVLAATEKVFIDGKLMTRGEENDYIIDYNRGDITFMPKRLVTKDSRIIVEFEYADQSYLRSTWALTNELNINKLRLSFNFYSEQDAKNSTGTQSLDSLEKTILRDAGNDFERAAPLSIRQYSDGFRSDRIQYQLKDSTVNNRIFRNILVYSANPDLAKFTASFTPVGEGKGNYIQMPSAVNGRIYEWIAPDSTGILRGNFEPIKKLTPPNSQQMWTLGTEYQLFKYTKLFAEVALSNNDRNLYSSIGDSTNMGLAVYGGLQNRIEFGEKKSWAIQTDIKLESSQNTFKPLNPYRPAEFTRDWNVSSNNLNSTNSTIGNLSQTLVGATEQFLNGRFSLSKNSWFSLSYEASAYFRLGNYGGRRNAGRFNFTRKGWNILADGSWLTTASGGGIGLAERSNFTRPKIDVSKTFQNNLKMGVYLEREKNERFDARKDTLTRASFYYDLVRFYVEKAANTEGVASGRTYGLSLTQRADYQPLSNRLRQISSINELNIFGTFNKNEHSQLTWNMTYRDLTVTDTSRTTLRPQQTYLGRVEYNFNAFKNAIYGNTLYEIGSGQEQRLEYQYVKVNKGEGQYIWRNRNNDTIPQLDEFEISPFRDQAEYVRVTLFTNQFVRTNNVTFSQSLRLDPRVIWYEKKGILKFLSKFSTNSAVQINRRVKNDIELSPTAKRVSQWNPFDLNIPDFSLVALNLTIRNSLFFNRSNPVWDIELGQLNNRNRSILVTGFEERGRSEIFFRNRWNISKKLTLINYFAHGTQNNESELFTTRNYFLELTKAEPQLTVMLGSDFRLVGAYKFKNGVNSLKINGEQITNNEFSLEATWNKTANSQFRTRFSYVQVAYKGERNTPIEFALLEGLQNGQNFIWNVSLDRTLSKNILLSLNYEGRKTGEVRTVHVGRAQVRANF